jgi:hypothetical protein
LLPPVQELKSQGQGFVTVLGSGVLVQTLIANELVDTYRLMLHPLVLGTGKRLFREYSHQLRLRLTECTRTTTSARRGWRSARRAVADELIEGWAGSASSEITRPVGLVARTPGHPESHLRRRFLS